jgi:hypothetical protein
MRSSFSKFSRDPHTSIALTEREREKKNYLKPEHEKKNFLHIECYLLACGRVVQKFTNISELACFTLLPWGWRLYVPLKRW